MKWTDLTADGSPLAPGMRDPAQLDICAYAGRCAPGFLAAHTDDRFPDYVLFESQNDAHFATADRGRTFFPVDLGAGAVLSSVRLHPAAAGRVLAHVVRLECFTDPSALCAQDLLFANELGRGGPAAWTNLTRNSEGRIVSFVDYDWAANALDEPAKAAAEDLAVLATVYEEGERRQAHAHAHTGGWDGDIDFVRSDDLFQGQHEHVLKCGNVLEALDGKLYVAVPNACEEKPGGDSPEPSAGVTLMVSDDGGAAFTAMCFPTELPSSAFFISDGDEGMPLVGVQHGGQHYGASGDFLTDVYTSDSRNTLFALSLPAATVGELGADISRVRFDTGAGDATIPEGVLLVNRALHPESQSQPQVVTVITHNRGGEWAPIPAPRKDAEGAPTDCILPQCSLHLHGSNSWYEEGFTGFYSHPSAPGYAIATGNMGAHLETESGLVNTYLTRDGGQTWEETLKGPHVYEYGDHGGIIVAAKHYMAGPADHLQWSAGASAGGRTQWHKVALPQPMHVKNIRVEGDFAARRFVAHGVIVGDDYELKGAVVLVDFEAKLDDDTLKRCSAADYEEWHLDRCMLGAKVTMTRRRPSAICYNGKEWEHSPPTVEPCACSSSDYECDYGAVRGADGACVNAISAGSVQACPAIDEKRYARNMDTLLRYIGGDRCDMKGGTPPFTAGFWRDAWDGKEHGVPGHAAGGGGGGGGGGKRGMSGFGKFVVGVLVVGLIAGVALGGAHFMGMPVSDWLRSAGDAAGSAWGALVAALPFGGSGAATAEYQTMRGDFEPLASHDELSGGLDDDI